MFIEACTPDKYVKFRVEQNLAHLRGKNLAIVNNSVSNSILGKNYVNFQNFKDRTTQIDGMEINGIDEGLNFDGDVDDGFVLPPPLNESLLADDPVNIAGENDVVNIQDNVDGDETQDSAEKKKKKRVCKPRVNLNEQRYITIFD